MEIAVANAESHPPMHHCLTNRNTTSGASIIDTALALTSIIAVAHFIQSSLISLASAFASGGHQECRRKLADSVTVP